MEVTLGSGAAVTVVPRGASNAAITPTTKSNCNPFRAASGAKIPNLGEQILAGTTANGRGLRFKAQVADVTKPLASVYSGCTVPFGPNRSFIRDSRSGKEIGTRKKMGNSLLTYILMHWAPSQGTPLLSGGRRRTCHRGARIHKTQRKQ